MGRIEPSEILNITRYTGLCRDCGCRFCQITCRECVDMPAPWRIQTIEDRELAYCDEHLPPEMAMLWAMSGSPEEHVK